MELLRSTLLTTDATTGRPCTKVWEEQGYESKAACIGDPANVKTGSVVEFMKSIANEVGFTWEVVPVTTASKDRFTSSFTACVHSVALNETDLCLGNFWLTGERMLIHRKALDFFSVWRAFRLALTWVSPLQPGSPRPSTTTTSRWW